jgi:3-mercaptopropionate dioxygenase
MMNNTTQFSTFIAELTQLVDAHPDEGTLLTHARQSLRTVITTDTWLPAACAVPRADRYAQYLLHCDPLERFSVVSFVWANDQATPVHNHTVWGLVGILRGAERCDEYAIENGRVASCGHSHVMRAGDVEAVSPTIGDWHRVSNADKHGVTVSIHVYGGNIGGIKRERLTENGDKVEFVSGYDGVAAWS